LYSLKTYTFSLDLEIPLKNKKLLRKHHIYCIICVLTFLKFFDPNFLSELKNFQLFPGAPGRGPRKKFPHASPDANSGQPEKNLPLLKVRVYPQGEMRIYDKVL
jgi:hypothetical protein